MVIHPKNIIKTDVANSLKSEEVYIVFVAGQSFLANGIATFQQCKWNHTGTIIWYNNEWQVAEANGYSVAPTPLEDFFERDKQYIIGRIDARKKGILTYKQWVKEIAKDFGKKPYDWLNLFFHQPVYFLTKRKLWIGSKKDGSNAYICGEHSAYAIDLYFYVALQVERESPVTLYEKLTKQKAITIIKTVNV